MSLEAYALINLCMNAITIGAVARSRGKVRWGCVLLSAAFGAVYAVAMQIETFSQLRAWPAKLCLAVLMTLGAVRVNSVRELFTAVGALLGCTLFLGGAQALTVRMMGGLSALGLTLGGAAGALALFCALPMRKHTIEVWEAQVLIERGGKRARLSAMIDTGNRLHEPLSGLPVLIVEEKRIAHLLPAELNAARPLRTLPLGFRVVSYGVLGGRGEMACFRPERLFVSYGDGWLRAPDVWVAVYPGQMPGAAHALAPAVLGRIQGAARRETANRGRFDQWFIRRGRQ